MPKEYPTEIVQPLGKHNPPFPCVKTEHVKDYVKYPYEYLNPPQSDFVKYLEDDDVNIVLASKTSSGKTVCAELFAARAIKLGKRVIYIAPMKALADEKLEDWTSPNHTFSQFKVEIQTGDFVLTEAKKAKLNESNIVILTPEMFNSKCRFYESHEWLHNSVVVVDECHLVGMEGRGDCLEVGLVQYFENNPTARILFLSATIPNVKDFETWLKHLTQRECITVTSEYRPCKLNTNIVTFQNTNYGKRITYQEIEEKRLEKVVTLVTSLMKDPVIVFVGNKDFGHKLSLELKALSVPHFFHNADLEREKRSKIEQGFRNLDFKVLISTTTTAWGVNTPARHAILSHTKFGISPMHPADVWQAMGRAGRTGYSDEGDAHIVMPFTERESEIKRIFKDYKVTSILNDVNTLMFHILSYVVNKKIKNAKELFDWYNKTLSSVQKSHLTLESSQKVLDNLAQRGMVKKDENNFYGPTKLGEVTARLYMSPLDVSDWFRNFSSLKYLNPPDACPTSVKDKVNLQVASAFSECFSWGRSWVGDEKYSNSKVYITNREKSSPTVIRVSHMLNTVPEGNPHLKYTAIFYNLLSGEDIDSALIPYSMAINKDLDRIVETMKQVDKICGTQFKRAGKIAGFDWGTDWDVLLLKLKYGVPTELISLVKIQGIGKTFAKKLYEKGIRNKEQLVKTTNKDIVANIVGKKRYETILKEAEKVEI